MLPTVAPTPAGLALAAERLVALRAALDVIGPTPCRATEPGAEYRRDRHNHFCEVAARQHCAHLGNGWRLYTYAAAHRRVGGAPTIQARLLWDQETISWPATPGADFRLPIPEAATAAQMAALWNAHITAEAAKAAATYAALLIPTE